MRKGSPFFRLWCLALCLSASSVAWSSTDPAKLEASLNAAQEAETHFAAGRFLKAAQAYERAYGLFAQTEYLQKIGEAYEKAPNACDKAEAAWRKFLRECGQCEGRALGEKRVAKVSAQCAKQKATALEPGAPAEAQKRYREARASLAKKDYAQALSLFRAAQLRWSQSAKIAYAIAQTLEAQGKTGEIVPAYEAALKLTIDTKARAKIEKLLTGLRNQAANLRIDVTVKTQPQNATVFVDGAAKAHHQTTPTKLSLSTGRHTLKLSLKGYHEDEVVVLVEANKKHSVERILRPLPPPPKSKWLAWTLGGVGVAAVVGGGLFHASAASTADSINQTDVDAYNRDVDKIQSNERMAWISYGIGGALVRTSAILLAKDSGSTVKAAGGKGLTGLAWRF